VAVSLALFLAGSAGVWACAQLLQAHLVRFARHSNGMRPRAGKKIDIRYAVVRKDWWLQ